MSNTPMDEAHRILEDIAGIKTNDLHLLTNKIIWDNIDYVPTTTHCYDNRVLAKKVVSTNDTPAGGVEFNCRCVPNKSSKKKLPTVEEMKNSILGEDYVKRFDAALAETRRSIVDYGGPFTPRHSGRYPWDMPARLIPSQGYLFANIQHIRQNTLQDYNIDTDTYSYLYSNNGFKCKFAVPVCDFERAMDRGEEVDLTKHIVHQLAKAYDQAMIREVFHMNYDAFNNFYNRINACGGSIEVRYESDCRPTAKIEIPVDRMELAFNMESKCAAIENADVLKKNASKGVPKGSPYIGIPGVDNVQFFNDRATLVTFTDGTSTKCVCDNEDIFQPSVGIAYCLFKRYLGGGKVGHARFNDLMRQARQAIEDNEKLEAQKQQLKEDAKARKARKAEIAKKRKAKKRQEKVDLIADAIRESKVVKPEERTEQA